RAKRSPISMGRPTTSSSSMPAAWPTCWPTWPRAPFCSTRPLGPSSATGTPARPSSLAASPAATWRPCPCAGSWTKTARRSTSSTRSSATARSTPPPSPEPFHSDFRALARRYGAPTHESRSGEGGGHLGHELLGLVEDLVGGGEVHG